MNTYFAPAERVDQVTLKKEIGLVTHSPIMRGLLRSVRGLLAVVNEQRQVIACNDELFSALNIYNPHSVLGIRPGEALGCAYANEHPGGCGTSKFCASCGAAIAMVSSLKTNEHAERLCALRTQKDDITSDIALKIHSQPIMIKNRRFLILFIQDITKEELQAATERKLCSDVYNSLQIETDNSSPKDTQESIRKAQRAVDELALQRQLMRSSDPKYHSATQRLNSAQIFREAIEEAQNHPSAKNITFSLSAPAELHLQTNKALLMRILSTMMINACEATTDKGTINLEIKQHGENVVFSVWNKSAIPPEIQLRIFQRHYSTKKQPGRGVGTYSMKLFGEHYLRGKVSFFSSPEEGTTFYLSLPTI